VAFTSARKQGTWLSERAALDVLARHPGELDPYFLPQLFFKNTVEKATIVILFNNIFNMFFIFIPLCASNP
jgi:hypothetical protein